MQLNNQAALVTGGGSGLGAATARALSSAGAKVAVLDLNIDTATAVAKEVGGMGILCDVTSAESMENAIFKAQEAQGCAQILINCAGVGTPGKAVGHAGPLPLHIFSQVIKINLIGTFNATRLVASEIKKTILDTGDKECGVIINTASVAAFDGQIGQPAYAASKGGIASMTLPLAREFAKLRIRVVTIAPGLFSTPMLHSLPLDIRNTLEKNIPFPARFGAPKEFAALVIHIIENSMLNGEVIRLDGAVRLPPK